MRIFTAAAALVLSLGAPLAAQATHDQARISFGVALGYVGRSHLWSVTGQALADPPLAPDTMSLSRQIRSGLTVGFQGTYFPGEHLGYTGEVFLLGLGYLDSCNLTYASGSSRNAQTCAYINGAEKAATAVALSGGVIYRFSSRRSISPFVRASGGVIIGSQSSIRTEGQFNTPEVGSEPVIVVVYDDQSSSHINPIGVLAAGFTTVLGPGYQIRWEARDNIAAVRAVTATAGVGGVAPPTTTRMKHLLGVSIGFEVVLERRRGRRY